MQVRDIMTADPACCTPDTPIPEVARLMLDCDCGEIPVVQDMETRRPAGVITDRDIVCRIVAKDQNPADMKAADAMTREVFSVSEDANLTECCEKMELHQVRRIPVLDAQGRICGIVSQADIARRGDSEETAEVVKDISRPSA